jgi:hypothetical protein
MNKEFKIYSVKEICSAWNRKAIMKGQSIIDCKEFYDDRSVLYYMHEHINDGFEYEYFDSVDDLLDANGIIQKIFYNNIIIEYTLSSIIDDKDKNKLSENGIGCKLVLSTNIAFHDTKMSIVLNKDITTDMQFDMISAFYYLVNNKNIFDIIE